MEYNYDAPVEIISNISGKNFKRLYLNRNKPVVIRGLWANYPATSKWTVEYFKEQLGNINVGIFDGKIQKNDRSFKVPDAEMKFSEFLTIITSDENSDIRLFLFNIFKHKPELRNDFDFPDFTKLFLKKISFMFFGGKNSVVRLHQDMDWSNVFLTQLHGRKEVILFPPQYSSLLYRFPFNVHSSVDVEKPDFEKYPGLKFVKGMHCVLEPGDTLFMPSGYWHYIKYIDGGYAINQRSLNPNPKFWIRGLWYVAVLSNLDEMMRHFLGNRWFEYKIKRSRAKANQSIARLS